MSTRTDRLQVIFEVGGDGKLKAAFAEIGRLGEDVAGKLDKSASSYDRMIRSAKLAGTVLGGSIVAGLGLVIKNTIEAERVDAQLEARLKSTAGAAGMTKQALDDLATATAKKTTFDDEAVKSAEALMLTFTKIHANVFPRAIAAVTDMSVALGTDLEGSVLQLGKALNDPIQGISALQRVGVAFSESQKDVIKNLVETGQVAEAQRLILAELETEFGGAAAAARDTFGGAVIALKNNLMDLTEGSGGSLDSAKDSVEALNKAMTDPSTKQSAADLTAALFKLADWGVTAGQAFVSFGKGLGIMLGEAVNQADAAWTIMKNLGSLGFADGTISDAMAQQKRGRDQFWKGMDDLVLANHGQTREGYNADFQNQFNLGLSGKTQVLGAGTGGSFNFAADQTAHSPGIGGGGKPAKPGRTSGGSGRSHVAAIDQEAEARKRLTAEIMSQLTQNDREIALMEVDKAHREELTAIYDTQHGALQKAKQAEKDAYVSSAKALDVAHETNQAKQDQIELDRQHTAATKQAQEALQDILTDQQFELTLLGLTNEARALEIAQKRAGAKFSPDKAQEFLDNENTIRGINQQIDAMDAARDSVKGFFEDVRHGANAWDAAKKALDSFADKLLSMIEDNLIGQLMGQQGTQGGGSSGGWITSLLGGLFGGGSAGGGFGGMFSSGWGDAGSFAGVDITGQGFAQGGHTDGRRAREVAEFGKPELFRANGRTWLLPGSAGQVVPMGAGMASNGVSGERGDNYAITVNVPRNTSYQTAQQTGQAAYAGAARAARRNG